ncbi:hypothetical protein BJ138DRAFT_261222 [Hygrophoropsis aurantiaca]|uniref:Uncharacterized protein n=1 Tax=Hygrophoropsis aurantiaca TaxID=72124 RepID=A0ACB8A7Y9_9AGAM|nr:hypothetical protein BJ138DRAFT_261222 [Hygrophoropsis aurantiaca]
MNHPISSFTAEDKQRDPYLSSVLSSTQKVIATAAVKVYYAPFNNPHINWSYSKLKGILVFGRDRDPSCAAALASRAGQSLRVKEKYWFRLVDVKTDRVVWMFSIPEVFEYKKDKPFFHYFSGTSRMFGFCFDEDEEASVFCKKVVDRTRRYFFSSLRTKSTKKENEKVKAPPSQKAPLKPAMISSPAPHSFVHVSHVGITTKGIVQTAKTIEPAWSTLVTELQGYGISPEVVKENRDFVEGFLAGAQSLRKNVIPPKDPVSFRESPEKKLRRKPVVPLIPL